MELTNIKKLIAKYFEGNTSLAEEKALQTYFTQDEIASELKAYQPLFSYFKEDSKQTFKLDALALPTTPKKSKVRVMKWFAVAASIVLLVSIYFQQKQPRYSKAEKMAAYHEYKKAMYLLGGEINKGVNELTVLKTFETTKNKIIK